MRNCNNQTLVFEAALLESNTSAKSVQKISRYYTVNVEKNDDIHIVVLKGQESLVVFSSMIC